MKPPVRELEVLLAVAHGESLRRIATRLVIAETSVRESLLRTRERYGTPNNEGAIAAALDREDIPASPAKSPISLKEAEADLLERIAMGQDDKTLMAELFASRSTIDDRVAALLARLGASNRCHAVYLGYRYGLLTGYRQRQARKVRDSEIAALSAVAQSSDVPEAARRLSLEPSTVKSYLRRSRRRLDARTTPQAIAIAIRRGEIQCPKHRQSSARLLDNRERRVMALIASGLTSGEIAARLYIGVRTVDRIISDVCGKLRAKSRSHAVYLLFAQGILR